MKVPLCLCLFCFFTSACVTVKPQQRTVLADPIMQLGAP